MLGKSPAKVLFISPYDPRRPILRRKPLTEWHSCLASFFCTRTTAFCSGIFFHSPEDDQPPMRYLVKFRNGSFATMSRQRIITSLAEGRLHPEMLCCAVSLWTCWFKSATLSLRSIKSFQEFSTASKAAAKWKNDSQHPPQVEEKLHFVPLFQKNRKLIMGALIGLFSGWVSSYLCSPPIARMTYSILEWAIEGPKAGFSSNILAWMSGGCLAGGCIAFLIKKSSLKT